MIFYFLITIVFIAELVITFALISSLLKADKSINAWNDFVEELKPDLREMMIAARKISEQMIILAPMLVNKIKSLISNFIVGQLKSLAGAFTFWLVRKEVEKHV